MRYLLLILLFFSCKNENTKNIIIENKIIGDSFIESISCNYIRAMHKQNNFIIYKTVKLEISNLDNYKGAKQLITNKAILTNGKTVLFYTNKGDNTELLAFNFSKLGKCDIKFKKPFKTDFIGCGFNQGKEIFFYKLFLSERRVEYISIFEKNKDKLGITIYQNL